MPSFWNSENLQHFGGITDVQVKSKIARGRRIRTILSQRQCEPLRLADEVALSLALQAGILDRLPLENIGKFRAALPSSGLDRSAASIVAEVERTGRLDDASSALLRTSVSGLVTQLAPPPAATGQRIT